MREAMTQTFAFLDERSHDSDPYKTVKQANYISLFLLLIL
jgi:hypothetical protein